MTVAEMIKALSAYPEDIDIKVSICHPQFFKLDLMIDKITPIIEMDTNKAHPNISLLPSHEDGWYNLMTRFTNEPRIEANKKPWGGWQSIYDEYYAKLETAGATNIYAKQKYGFLRFEVECNENSDYKEIQRLMDEAEEKSLTICEDCGGIGAGVEVDGWFYTLCRQCADNKKEASR